MSTRLHVLVVSPDLPSPPASGSTMRVYKLARQLSAQHDVSLLSYGDRALPAAPALVGTELVTRLPLVRSGRAAK